MYGTFTVVVGFEYGLVDESVAIPFVFVGVHFGKVDGHFYQVAEHVRLGKCLAVHLSNPCGRPVGRYDYQRNLLIESLGYGGVEIEQSRS